MRLNSDDTRQLMLLMGMGHCGLHVGKPGLVHYAYKIDDIIKQVKKLTNYVGGSRTNKNGVTLVDKYSYTDDEFDLDHFTTADAMAQVYTVLMEYTKGVSDSYKFDEGYNEIVVKQDMGLLHTTSYAWDSETRELTWTVKTSAEIPDNATALLTYVVSYDVVDIFGKETKRWLRQDTKIKPNHKNPEQGEDGRVTYTVVTKPAFKVDEQDNGLGAEQLLHVRVEGEAVRIVERSPRPIKEGDVVKVEYPDGRCATYVATQNTDTTMDVGRPGYYRHLGLDFRNTIHYVLFFPQVLNDALLSALDTHIFMALIEYCTYRWFLLVAPEEAETYYKLFNARLETIKGLLDTMRAAISRRSYIWF